MIGYLNQLLLFVIFLIVTGGCTENQKSGAGSYLGKKYSLFVMDKEGNTSIAETNDLSKGKLDPSNENILKDYKGFDRDVIVKEGYYYKLNYKTGIFTRFKNRGNSLEPVGEISLKRFFIENYLWINDSTLLLFDMDKKNRNTALRYVIVKTRDMQVVRDSSLLIISLNTHSDAYIKPNVGFSVIRGKVLILGYNYFIKEPERYKAADTTYIAAFTYPSMELLSISKDTRSVNPGGENMVEPGSFTDEKGDFYYLTCPGIALGNSPNKPTALFKIKKNELQPDTSYFFNISASPIQNHAYSIYYLGRRKAIVRSERKDLFTRWDDHWRIPHFEFYLVDVDTKEITKLDLPLDKGTRRQCVLQEGDKVYISINSESEGNYIWRYDLKTGRLAKGLELIGSTDFILRMDKLD